MYLCFLSHSNGRGIRCPFYGNCFLYPGVFRRRSSSDARHVTTPGWALFLAFLESSRRNELVGWIHLEVGSIPNQPERRQLDALLRHKPKNQCKEENGSMMNAEAFPSGACT
jgi:hypothetical protein